MSGRCHKKTNKTPWKSVIVTADTTNTLATVEVVVFTGVASPPAELLATTADTGGTLATSLEVMVPDALSGTTEYNVLKGPKSLPF